MKKTILSIGIAFLSSAVFSQNASFKVSRDTFNGKEVYKYLTDYYPAGPQWLGEHVEISVPGGNSRGLTLCIKMERLREYDSALISAFEKFKEWSVLADSLGSEKISKQISKFKVDGTIIYDYGVSIGDPVEIEFIFSRSYPVGSSTTLTNNFYIKCHASDENGIRRGLYWIRMEETPIPREYWELNSSTGERVTTFTKPKDKKLIAYHSTVSQFEIDFAKNNQTVEQQLSSYRKMIDPNRIISQYKSSQDKLSSFK